MIALAGAVYGLGWIKGANHEQLKAAKFEAATVALGQAAKLRTDAVIKADKLRKETADAENNRTLDSLRADIKRLRDNRASGNFLPAAPAGAGRPDLACFDRALLERAIRDLDKGVQGIVDQCSETTVNLDTAKKWAKTK
jgi:hypothetical protein